MGCGFLDVAAIDPSPLKPLIVAAKGQRTEQNISSPSSVACYDHQHTYDFLSNFPATSRYFRTKSTSNQHPVHSFTSTSLLPAIFLSVTGDYLSFPAISLFRRRVSLFRRLLLFSGEISLVLLPSPPPPRPPPRGCRKNAATTVKTPPPPETTSKNPKYVFLNFAILLKS